MPYLHFHVERSYWLTTYATLITYLSFILRLILGIYSILLLIPYLEYETSHKTKRKICSKMKLEYLF